MEPGLCPWDGFDPATISFCEARLCGWVAEPANAFTSLTKTMVGVVLLVRCLRIGGGALWAIVVAALIQGPFGFSLHATGTFWGEALDVSGMFLISGMFVTFALARVRRWPAGRLALVYAGLTLASVAMLLTVRPSGIWVFIAQLVVWVGLEVAWARARPDADRRWLWRMVACFAIGFAFWSVDKTGIACDPDNHVVNGHAVWHVLTSVCLYLFFRYEEAMSAATRR